MALKTSEEPGAQAASQAVIRIGSSITLDHLYLVANRFKPEPP